MIVAYGAFLIRPGQRLPHLRAIVRIGRNRKLKIWPHHTDDCERLLIQRDILAHNVAISPEPATPQVVTQDDFVLATWRIFFCKERAAQQGLCPQNRKEATRNGDHADCFRMTCASQRVLAKSVSRHLLECLASRTPIEEIG